MSDAVIAGKAPQLPPIEWHLLTEFVVHRLLLALLTSSTLLAAPRPKGGEAVFFPTKAGDTSVYEVTTGGGGASERTTVVKKVEEIDGGWAVSVETGPRQARYEVTEKGVLMSHGEGRDATPPMPLLKLPAAGTPAWEYRTTDGNGKAILLAFKVSGEEEVKVPAGTFKAVRVDMARTAGGDTVSGTLWFAPRVGPVKQVTEAGKTVRTEVLKSFTPGK